MSDSDCQCDKSLLLCRKQTESNREKEENESEGVTGLGDSVFPITCLSIPGI